MNELIFHKQKNLIILCLSAAFLLLIHIIYRVESKIHIQCLQLAILSCKKNQYRQNEFSFYQILGIIYKNLGKIEESIEIHTICLERAKETGDKLFEAGSLGNLGICFYEIREFNKAVDYHKLAIPIFETSQKFDSLAREFTNLGNAFLGNEQPYETLICYKKALKYLDLSKIKDIQAKANLFNSLGALYLNYCKYKKSIKYLFKSLEIAEQISEHLLKARILANLGLVYRKLGEKNNAKDYFLQALVIFEAIESPNVEIMRRNLANLESESES